MANFNNNAASFINGLSDFWLLYFKEVDQLSEFYKGTEILVGQSYLDLMSLLLNNSVRDAVLFNKEFFKLLQVKESDIRFEKRSFSSASRYVLELPDDIVTALHLNNKILSPTVGLDREVEYFEDRDNRTFEFVNDPTNAYKQYTFGSLNTEFTVREKLLDSPTIRIKLVDDGTAPVAISRTDYDITVSYDGPANSSTSSAKDIVQKLNLDPLTKGLVVAEVTGINEGKGSPTATGGLVALKKVASNPIDGFATKRIETFFDAKITCSSLANWVDLGVEKGDIVRLISGPSLGKPQEASVKLVRPDALYLDVEGDVRFTASDKYKFAVLRQPSDGKSKKEPYANSGFITQNGTDGEIDASTRQFSSVTANFAPVHEGDVIDFFGVDNADYGVILNVIDSATVEIGVAGLTDETALNWQLHTTLDPSNISSDGVLTNNDDGTATFTSASANFTTEAAGTVLKLYRAGEIETYNITEYVSATEITVEADASVADGTALDWGWAKEKTPAQAVIFSPPTGWPIRSSAVLNAKRLVDGETVKLGRDFEFSSDTGKISPLTVWRTSLDNTVTYEYRTAVVENTTSLQSGSDGSITVGSPNTFSSPSASFTADHIGHSIVIGNSGLSGVTNNGTHFISGVVSSTEVELSEDKLVPSTTDPNNGSLDWELFRRGEVETEDVSEFQAEMAMWAPDALVDRFNLYNTFGYLINRFEKSSEQYRALIRGVFQLFMLGPTLERFESAINTVAGLPVIRDEGELLVNYDNGASETGTNGSLDFSTKIFTDTSKSFTTDNVGDFLYITDGVNSNTLFKVVALVSSTELLLDRVPTTDSGVSWEITSKPEQTVVTTRADYVFDRRIPLKEKIKDSSNFGTYFFSSFEVLADVFNVTDYIETPNWWEFTQIPEELWPDEPSSRRQSTSKLFENVIAPADDGHVGDPGFVIGADSEGFKAPDKLIRDDAGATDGELVSDPLYPVSNDVRFKSATAAFTGDDIGRVVTTEPGTSSEQEFRITSIVSASEVKVEAFTDIEDASGLDWEINSRTLAKRHKAAFIILDKFLKHHLFSVRFDLHLLDLLPSSIIDDLRELVFVAKPTYTYLVLTPTALFEEIIDISETFELDATTVLGGTAGTIISANASPLTIIGESWQIGHWFRYIDTSSTFSAPTTEITEPLGTPDAGYEHYVNKVYIEPSDFTSGGDPIHVAEEVFGDFSKSGTGLEIDTSSGDTVVTLPAGTLVDQDIMATLRVSDSLSGNNGDYTLGSIADDQTATIYSPGASDESGLSWEILYAGTVVGKVSTTSTGSTTFEDSAGLYTFDSSHVGNYIRRPFVGHISNQVFRINSVSGLTADLATLNRVEPAESEADATGDINGGQLIVPVNTIIFNAPMGRQNRDSGTEDAERYYIVFTSGVNSGSRSRVNKVLDNKTIELVDPIPADDSSVNFYIEAERAYNLTAETANWEQVREEIVIQDTKIDLSNTPSQDANASVNYTAYGVREPLDVTAETFDDTAGDTMYSIGMNDPKQKRGKSRTGKETDLREEPLQVTRTTV